MKEICVSSADTYFLICMVDA